MELQELQKFLIAANKAGFASGDENSWVKEKDGSTTIRFSSGEWKLEDNYFGGEPYGGRLIVFHKKKAVWIMIYYGKVDQNFSDIKGVYAFLQKCLLLMPEETPLRGPKKHEEGSFRYENTWDGSLEQYSGEEIIFKDSQEIYRARYIGGLVDTRLE